MIGFSKSGFSKFLPYVIIRKIAFFTFQIVFWDYTSLISVLLLSESKTLRSIVLSFVSNFIQFFVSPGIYFFPLILIYKRSNLIFVFLCESFLIFHSFFYSCCCMLKTLIITIFWTDCWFLFLIHLRESMYDSPWVKIILWHF